MTRDADSNFSDLITLEDACKFFLHGKVTVATLRAEHKAERLEIYRIGRRDWTTLSDLKDMQKKCRVAAPAQSSGSIRRVSDIRSATAKGSAAQTAVALRLEQRKKNSKVHSRKAYVVEKTSTAIGDILLTYINEVTTGQISESASLLAIARLNKWWGDKFIADITPANCRAYITYREGKPISRTELSYLRASLRHWHKNHAPILIPSIIMPDKPPARERWLTRSEAAAFLWNARRSPHVARFFIIGWYTGSRKTVILNLKWSMIDLKTRIARRKPAGAVQTKKRAPPFRVGGRLLSHLRRWKRMDGKEQLLIRFPGRNQGNPLKQIDTAWNKARDAAGLSDDVTPHTLRHSRATHMMQQKVDVWEAAQFLGMSVNLLETTYGHHRPDWQTGAADAD